VGRERNGSEIFKRKTMWVRFEDGRWGLRAGREKVLDRDLDWDLCLLGDLDCLRLDWVG
jgi:hypothetical protein